jgi:ribosome-associated protein
VSRVDDGAPRSRPSRSQKKRAVEVYEVLARELVEMTGPQYAQLDVPGELQDEIALARRTRSPGARKRQTKYLAGVLRQSDDETQSLIAALQRQRVSHRTEQVLFHGLEALRDRICDAERMEAALREAGDQWPALDVDKLASLAKQVQDWGDRRARREIFRRLRLVAEATTAAR